MSEKFTKILARYQSDLAEKIVVETLWAEEIDTEKGLYKIDNIPFYWPPFSADDIVRAEFDENENFLTFRNIVEPSGNSTVQIIIPSEDFDTEKFIENILKMNIEVEKFHSQFLVCNVPKTENYKNFYNFLREKEKAWEIAFAEPNISKKHFSEK